MSTIGYSRALSTDMDSAPKNLFFFFFGGKPNDTVLYNGNLGQQTRYFIKEHGTRVLKKMAQGYSGNAG